MRTFITNWLYDTAATSGNFLYNAGAGAVNALWSVMPKSFSATTYLSPKTEDLIHLEEALQHHVPLDHRRGDIESHNAYAYQGITPVPNQKLPITAQLKTGIPSIIEWDIHVDHYGTINVCHGSNGDFCLGSAPPAPYH